MIDSDPLLRDLQRLPALEPHPARVARARARCHAAIMRRAREADPCASDTSLAAALDRGLLWGLCVVYLAAMVYDVLRLRDL